MTAEASVSSQTARKDGGLLHRDPGKSQKGKALVPIRRHSSYQLVQIYPRASGLTKARMMTEVQEGDCPVREKESFAWGNQNGRT